MRDCCRFSNEHASGKVLAVLEGGYSDRALASGALALTVAMTESPRLLERTFVDGGDEGAWWSEPALIQLEKACKPRRGKVLASAGSNDWLSRAVDVFSQIEGLGDSSAAVITPPVESKDDGKKMQLRERRPRTWDITPQPSPTKLAVGSRSKLTGNGRTPTTTPAKASVDTPREPPQSAQDASAAAPSNPVEAHGTAVQDTAQAPVPKIKFTWKQGGL
jgi:histone deacetylase HOS3